MKKAKMSEQEQELDRLDALLPESPAEERDFLLRLLMTQKNEEIIDLMMDIAQAQDAVNRERLEQEVWHTIAQADAQGKAGELAESCNDTAAFMETDLAGLQAELSTLESFVETARGLVTTQKYLEASEEDIAFFAEENDDLYDCDDDHDCDLCLEDDHDEDT